MKSASLYTYSVFIISVFVFKCSDQHCAANSCCYFYCSFNWSVVHCNFRKSACYTYTVHVKIWIVISLMILAFTHMRTILSRHERSLMIDRPHVHLLEAVMLPSVHFSVFATCPAILFTQILVVVTVWQRLLAMCTLGCLT